MHSACFKSTVFWLHIVVLIIVVLCRWFGLRIDIISAVLAVVVTFSSIALRGCKLYITITL